MEIVTDEVPADSDWSSNKAIVSCGRCGVGVLIPIEKMGPFITKEELKKIPKKEREMIPKKIFLHKTCAAELQATLLLHGNAWHGEARWGEART